MRLLAIFLLAVCLIQGNNAQFSGLLKLVGDVASGARNAAANVASGAVNAATNVASGAVNSATGVITGALDGAANIRSRLSGGAQSLLDSASADVSIDSLTDAANLLSLQDLLQTAEGAAAEVRTIADGVQKQIEGAVNSMTEHAKASMEGAISGWNNPVKAMVEKAKEVGVDIRDCHADTVAKMSETAVGSAVKCVTDKVTEAVTLGKNIAGLPVRAGVLAKEGGSAYNKCRKTSNTFFKRACQVRYMTPVAVKSALLVKDTLKYASQATTLVTTIKSQLTFCAAKVTASAGIEAVKTAGSIVGCVRGKLAKTN